MSKYNRIFFCDNCSSPRTSSKHKVTLTNEGTEIVADTCEFCGMTQEIILDENKKISKFRVKNNQEDDKNESK